MKIKEIILNDDIIKKFFNKNVEVRIDFITVLTSKGFFVPILFYSLEQECSYAYNTMNIDRDTLVKKINGYKEIIATKIKEVEEMLNDKVVSISLTDNLHTHPVGIHNFSSTDYEYVLESDWSNDSLGINLLYSFDGDLYQSVVRQQIDGKYDYFFNTPINKEYDFKPHIDINENNFKINNNFYYNSFYINDFYFRNNKKRKKNGKNKKSFKTFLTKLFKF